jgi:CRP-like cAMP-binding protein
MRAGGTMEPTIVSPTEKNDLMNVIERGEVLRTAKIFQSLRVEELAAVATLTREVRVKKGAVIFEEGDTGGTLYMVAEGRVHALKGDRVLFEAKRGRSVGSLSLLDGLPTDYTAVAQEDSVLLRLDREPFLTLLNERNRAVMSVLSYVTGVVRGLNEAPDVEAQQGHAVGG